MAGNINPDRDASLGLIFRLNNLWSLVDYASIGADYKKWNNLLDAIRRNLLFRENVIVDVDEITGKVTKVRFTKNDKENYKILSVEISKAIKEYNGARSKVNKGKARNKWYHKLQNKDVWLRKFMQKLKLYMKESEQRPGSSTFGTFGRGK